MLSLVSAEGTGRLDLRSRASGEFLVEANDALHADGIRGRTDSLGIALHCQQIFVSRDLSSIVVKPLFSPSTTCLLSQI